MNTQLVTQAELLLARDLARGTRSPNRKMADCPSELSSAYSCLNNHSEANGYAEAGRQR